MREASSVAAKWWKDQLASNSKDKYNHVISEDHPIFILNYIFQDKCTPSQLIEFYTTLKGWIDEELEKNDEIKLYSLHYPCRTLERIGNQSNICGLSFPMFAEMIITKDLVKVKFLEQKKYKVLYQNSKEEQQ